MKVKVISDVAVSPNLSEAVGPRTCAYPLTTVMSDGALVCAYRGGQEKHTYDGIFLSQRSSDSGDTWSPPAVVCDKRKLDPPQSVTSGGVCRTADGSVLCVFKTVEVTKPGHYVYSQEGRKQGCTVYSSLSRDAGSSWSEPKRVNISPYDEHTGVASKALVLPGGELLIPLETKPANRASTTLGSFSLDNGETIGPFAELGLGDPAEELDICDARFTLVGDEVLALLWAFRCDTEETIEVHRSTSRDNGRSWSAPQSTGFVGQVTAPLGLGNDVVIAASNYRHPPEGIRLWLSRDGGETWKRPPMQMWDPNQNRIVAEPVAQPVRAGQDEGVWEAMDKFTFGTPDLVVLPDRTILLTYYATLKGITHIRACRFELKEKRRIGRLQGGPE